MSSERRGLWENDGFIVTCISGLQKVWSGYRSGELRTMGLNNMYRRKSR